MNDGSEVAVAVSSNPPSTVTNDNFCGDGIPADPLMPPGSYIDAIEVELNVRLDATTPNKGDVFDLTPCKLEIRRKIAPVHQVKLERPKRLPENWRFETKVRTSGETAGFVDRYYFEPVSGKKFRSRNEVDYFLKTGCKRKKAKIDIDSDGATTYESKKQKKSSSKKEKRN